MRYDIDHVRKTFYTYFKIYMKTKAVECKCLSITKEMPSGPRAPSLHFDKAVKNSESKKVVIINVPVPLSVKSLEVTSNCGLSEKSRNARAFRKGVSNNISDKCWE